MVTRTTSGGIGSDCVKTVPKPDLSDSLELLASKKSRLRNALETSKTSES